MCSVDFYTFHSRIKINAQVLMYSSSSHADRFCLKIIAIKTPNKKIPESVMEKSCKVNLSLLLLYTLYRAKLLEHLKLLENSNNHN